MENQVRDLLHDLADEVPPYRAVPRDLPARAHRRIVVVFGVRAIVVGATVLLAVVTAHSLQVSEGREPSPPIAPSPSSMEGAAATGSVTLSEGGCVYDGPDAVAAGEFRLRVSNPGETRLYVALLLIDEGHTYNDLEAWVAKLRPKPPNWVTVATDGDIAPGGGRLLSSSVDGGTYGIVCAQPKAGSGPTWTAASITVTA